jgi:AcrR family transcriptional regulator
MGRPATGIRQRILTAAREVFDSRGVDAASLRVIARTARTTMGMIYYYFTTKEDLYLAVVEEVYARVLGDFAAALGPGGEADTRPLRQSLEDLLLRLARLSAEDRAVARIVLREVAVSAERRHRLVARFERGHIPIVIEAIQRARARGEIRADLHPAMIVFATAGLSALSTLLLEHLPMPGLPRGDARIAATLELLFAGIAAPPASKRPRATRRARRTSSAGSA